MGARSRWGLGPLLLQAVERASAFASANPACSAMGVTPAMRALSGLGS